MAVGEVYTAHARRTSGREGRAGISLSRSGETDTLSRFSLQHVRRRHRHIRAPLPAALHLKPGCSSQDPRCTEQRLLEEVWFFFYHLHTQTQRERERRRPGHAGVGKLEDFLGYFLRTGGDMENLGI
ncbi:hypothetical protein PBY51_015631 [Eleginops maclovinus]|uniref:Uncharacterized protein n=1 Tax=Eleginops maclovinus TaxID=56733 RepID=A0AAN7XR81_ELEMC|nr:hypothetical protein PBY51_015631 [Eleginops maclovinus]